MEPLSLDISVALGEINVSNNTSFRTATHSNEPSEKLELEVNEKQEKRAWLVVVGCFILYFNMLGITYSFGIYEAHYALHEFHGQSARVALIGSVSSGTSLAVCIVAGRWVELYGVRAVIVAGSIIFSGSLAAAGFCKSLTALILTQGVLTGVGIGILNIPGTTAMIPWFPNHKSFALGIASSGAGLGGIFWSFVTRALISKLSYQWALWVMASISAALHVIAIILIKDPPILNLQENWRAERRSYRDELGIFKDPKFVTLYIANVLSLFGYLVPFFYIPTFAQTQLGSSAFVGAVLAADMDFGMSLGRIILGYFANSSFGTMNVIIISMAISALGQICLWLPSTDSIILLFICAFVYGFFGGGSAGIVPVVLAQIFPPNRLPSITGIFMSSNLPGAISGSPIAGTIFDASHSKWTPVILYSSSIMLAGALIMSITRFQVERRLFATV